MIFRPDPDPTIFLKPDPYLTTFLKSDPDLNLFQKPDPTKTPGFESETLVTALAYIYIMVIQVHG